MSQIGRIGGPVLSADLLRDGSDLAFETDLLYLSVRDLSNLSKTVGLGINNNSPSQKLQITGTSHFARSNPLLSDWYVTTQADLADLVVLTYKIQNPTGNINIIPNQSVDPKIVANEIRTSKLKLVDSAVSTLASGDHLEVTANGNGEVEFYTTKVKINGNLQVTGNLQWDGSIITIGSDNTDQIIFNADIKSDIRPNVTDFYTLGSSTKKWNTLYSKDISASTLTADSLVSNGVNLLSTQGNTIYVSINGNNSNIGIHLHNTYRTIKYALSQAVAGDNIVIFPGTYTEDFPLTVPQGVSVTGAGLRAVIISPSIGTNTKDAFLLNGETTVSHLSVKDVYYDAVNNTGYAFRFANGFTVTTRSPYVQDVSVLNSSPNAGPGALVDGSVANPASIQASMLFRSVTFIVPGADGITATNGARVEWLNSFTYFANRGIYLTEGALGFASNGKTRLRVNGVSAPTVVAGDTITLYSDVTPLLLEDGSDTLQLESSEDLLAEGITTSVTDVLASAIIESITYNTSTADIVIDGKIKGWEIPASLAVSQNIDFSGGQTATQIITANYNDFGAEFRSISSANIYGTYGAVADGVGTLGYLVAHSFGYIGTGSNSQNDYDLVIQANEVVAINGGRLYYDSMNHLGDYRIGDIFYVNQETGTITFNAQSLDFSADGRIVIEGIDGRSVIDSRLVSTGNIVVHDNNIDSVSGSVNFSAQSGTTTLNTNVNVTGTLGVTGNVLVKGNVYLGDNPLDTVSVIPRLTQTIKPDLNNTFTLGTGGITPKVWNTAFLTSVNVDNVTQISSNTVTTLTTDTDLRLVAAGTGIISAPLKSVDITNNLQVTGTTTVNGTSSLKNTEIGTILSPKTLTLTGDINQTGNVNITGLFANNNNITQLVSSVTTFATAGIRLIDNKITATSTNADLVISASGVGGVILDSRVKITDNTISNVWSGATSNSEKSIYFTPNGTGNVVISSTKSIQIPVSNDSNRILTALGEVRLNSTTQVFEGKITGGIIPLKGIYDSDRNTYITPELTIGANDNTLRFYNNGTLTTRINSSALLNNLIHVDNIRLSDNTVNNRITGDDLIFASNGTGAVNLNNISFPANTIRNNSNSPLTFNSTGVGYVKFNGTYGVVIPIGTGNSAFPPGTPQNQRPLTAEVGEVRHNTTLSYMEVFDGTNWTPATGASGAASLAAVLDIMDEWALILG